MNLIKSQKTWKTGFGKGDKDAESRENKVGERKSSTRHKIKKWIKKYSENKQIFKKRKGINNIDKNLLAHKIAYSVIDNCGYQIDLYGDKSIEEFASDYLSFEEKNSWSLPRIWC